MVTDIIGSVMTCIIIAPGSGKIRKIWLTKMITAAATIKQQQLILLVLRVVQ